MDYLFNVQNDSFDDGITIDVVKCEACTNNCTNNCYGSCVANCEGGDDAIFV